MNEPSLIREWADLDDFIRRETAWSVAQGALPPTLAISFVGERPDVLMQAPTFVLEEADEIIDELIAFFGLLRPDRLAVLWPTVAMDEHGGEPQFGVRVNAAERGQQGWTWTTRVLGTRCTQRRVVGWDEDVVLGAEDLDPWSRRLRTLYDEATHRRLRRHGLLRVREDGGWAVMTHPDSSTFDGLERLCEVVPRVPGTQRSRPGSPGPLRRRPHRDLIRRRPSGRREP